MIQKAHNSFKKIGVWHSKKTSPPENSKMYDIVFSHGVDYFVSDFPVTAMKARDKI